VRPSSISTGMRTRPRRPRSRSRPSRGFHSPAHRRASHPLSRPMNDPFPGGRSRVANRRLGAFARAVAAGQIGNADPSCALTFIYGANIVGHAVPSYSKPPFFAMSRASPSDTSRWRGTTISAPRRAAGWARNSNWSCKFSWSAD